MILQAPLIVASSSPRRQYLMREAGFEFNVEKPDVDESFPDTLPVADVAKYLAEKKAEYFRARVKDEIVLTADTVVIIDNTILNKPLHREEAIAMLTLLSGRTHQVKTGVSILYKTQVESFDDTTEVTFQSLTKEEITYYVDTYKPYDKAGAYGAQDWIGMVAIQKIVGSYFTVMGLPIHLVYERLKHYKK